VKINNAETRQVLEAHKGRSSILEVIHPDSKLEKDKRQGKGKSQKKSGIHINMKRSFDATCTQVPSMLHHITGRSGA